MMRSLVAIFVFLLGSALAEGRHWKQVHRQKMPEKLTPASRIRPRTLQVKSPLLNRPRSSIEIEPITAKRLLEKIEKDSSELLLVNLWATWSKPSREEFPDLLKISLKYQNRGLKMIHVSTDDRSRSAQVRRYLQKLNITGKAYLRLEPKKMFIKGIHRNWSGSLPAVLLFRKGKLVKFWEGKARYGWFDSTLKRLM